MSNTIVPFKNIAVASNEPLDYYTVNRAFTRLYDIITDVSGYVTDPNVPVAEIPYATLTDAGFVQFTDTISGVNNNKIISTNEILNFINNRALPATVTSSRSAGAGYLLNDIKYQYGWYHLANTPTLSARNNTILFNNTNIPAFTLVPHIMYQAYSGYTTFDYKILIKDITTTSASIITHNNDSLVIPGLNAYILWLAIGV